MVVFLSGGAQRPSYTTCLDTNLAGGGLWHKRAALLATLYFLRRGETAQTHRLVEAMVKEEHDLLQKAVGWMVREMGKVDAGLLEHFLREHAPRMPRTMLRYAIERLPEDQRRQHLSARRVAAAVRASTA